MALSTTILEARIDAELKILGLFTSTVKTNILRDAVYRFCRKVDKPIISANLTVTASTGPYSIPSTLEKLVDVYDNSTTPVTVKYSIDETKAQITFADTPTAGTYTCYGTPKNIRTNLTAVVAAISEDHEDVLWAYIRAMAMQQANSSSANDEIGKADKAARELRQSLNMKLDILNNTMRFKDTTGQRIADGDNLDGYAENINDYLESDLEI